SADDSADQATQKTRSKKDQLFPSLKSGQPAYLAESGAKQDRYHDDHRERVSDMIAYPPTDQQFRDTPAEQRGPASQHRAPVDQARHAEHIAIITMDANRF